MAENNGPEIDEESLVLRMMDRDQSALAELLKLYGPKIRGYLRKKFGDVLKEPELQQALNCAAFNVWRFADRFDPAKGSLRAWFVRIARNAAFSIIRVEARHLAKSLEYEPAYDPADDSEVPSADISDQDVRRLKAIDEFINNTLSGFEKIVAINSFKSGGEADSTRLAALYGKTRGNVDVVKSKVKKKITQAMLEWESLQPVKKGKP